MASGFVSASELDEERKKRQEEWEKVRKPEDPVAAPELEVCNKTLFEQLRDNKEVKDDEYKESRKFKNMIRGIDEEESEFLSRVGEIKAEAIRNKRKEEEELMREMAEARGQLVDSTTGPTISRIAPVPTNQPQKSKQASILSVAIKRKSATDETPAAKVAKKEDVVPATPAASAMKVIGRIPGMGDYAASSDSESSDSSDDDAEMALPLLVTSQPIKKKESDH